MPKTVKYLAIAAGAILGLCIIGVGIIAATFDPNLYKPQLIQLVQEKMHRTLTIPGDISLAFFPKLGADLGKISISERNNTAEFASVESAKLSLSLIPLLSKQFVVDQIHIDGLRANIRRNKDGATNFDDFIAKDTKDGQKDGKDDSGQPVKFNIDSVSINNAYVMYDDQQSQRKIELAKLNMKSGKIASGEPGKFNIDTLLRSSAPEVNASIKLKSDFTFDLEQHRYALRGMNAEVRGNFVGFTDMLVKLSGNADVSGSKQMALEGIKFSAIGKHAEQNLDTWLEIPKLSVTDAKVTGSKITGSAKLNEGTRSTITTFDVTAFDGSTKAFRVPSILLDTTIKDGKLDARAKLSGELSGDIDKMLFTSPQITLALSGKQGDTAINGTLTTPLSANMQAKLIELANVVASFALPNPAGGALAFSTQGNVHADLGKENVAAKLKGKLDESNFDAALGMTTFSSPDYSFRLDIDRLDLDRYKAKPSTKTATATTVTTAKTAEADKPMDLAALNGLKASGSLRIGALKMANIRTSNVRATLHAADGKLDVNPLAANLYSGNVNGSLSLTAGKPMHVAVKQNLAGVQVGPLLRDALEREPMIEGKGNVQLDIATSGGGVAQFKKGLNGSAKLALRDGSVKGINLAQTIRSAKSKLNVLGATSGGETQAQTGTGSSDEKTDFSELTGSFRIANGVAHNDDLSLKSPLVRAGGNGDINVGEDRLDYLVKATVVPSLKGQGGPELQALSGVTIPVKLTGPYTSISWHVDVAGMAAGLAKQKLDEQKDALKAKAQKQLQDSLGNGLKGLFGR
jgi:AsmA protein